MDREEIENELIIIRDSLLTKVNNLSCYLFGSILINPRKANDIDILFVYEKDVHLQLLKQQIKTIKKDYPLHIIYLTYFEEDELDFIGKQKAKLIFKV